MGDTASARLYSLLPSIYRVQDEKQGYPLKALLSVLDDVFRDIESDIGRMYDDWFIETCQEWVVPYIADLLGVRGLSPIRARGFSHRAFVANTLAYRRRKGTVAVLEQLSRDVTQWPAKAVEYFQLLGTSQYMNHLRLESHATADLRDGRALERLGGPFQRTAHTIDVRRIRIGRGRYNIPNVGVFLWRLRSYPIDRGDARGVGDPALARFTFDPLGKDVPLFNRPVTEREIAHLAGESDVPDPLRRRDLYEELEALRQGLVDGAEPPSLPHFGNDPVLEVRVGADPEPVPPEEILICDLSTWRRPSASVTYRDSDRAPADRPIRLAVDPVLGRITFPEGVAPREVLVNYLYGFSGDVGAGPYNREESVAAALPTSPLWQRGVRKGLPAPEVDMAGSFAEAVKAWNENAGVGSKGIIAVLDSRTYEETLGGDAQHPEILIPAGSQLLLVAADWPKIGPPGLPQMRIPGKIVPSSLRPVLRGGMAVRGTAPADAPPGSLTLDGLTIEGTVTVRPGNLGAIRLSHSTVGPGSGQLLAEGSANIDTANVHLRVEIDHSITAPIALATDILRLEIADSIIDAAAGISLTGPGCDADIQSSTILGVTTTRTIEAGNSIFMGAVRAMRRQVGCMRFSYEPMDATSRTPRRYRCQPDTGLTGFPEAERAARAPRFRPTFTSDSFGAPGFAQLSLTCPGEIRTGAEDGSEMGAFRGLAQPLREANARLRIGEYLPSGMEAGLIFVT